MVHSDGVVYHYIGILISEVGEQFKYNKLRLIGLHRDQANLARLSEIKVLARLPE